MGTTAARSGEELRRNGGVKASAVYVHVANGAAVDLTHLEHLISSDELRRADLFRRDEDRSRFVIGRAMARQLLGDELGVSPRAVDIEIDSRGKPRVNLQRLSSVTFNIAHAGSRVVVATAHTTDVGVDLEPLRQFEDAARLARRFFHVDEQRALGPLPADARAAAFLRLWTRKEALGKAIGAGLHGVLDRPFMPLTDCEFHVVHDGRNWCVTDLDLDVGWFGAVAAAAPAIEVIVRGWEMT